MPELPIEEELAEMARRAGELAEGDPLCRRRWCSPIRYPAGAQGSATSTVTGTETPVTTFGP